MPVSLTVRRILTIYPVELPLFHPIAVKLLQLLHSSDFTIEEIIDLANEDQSLASKILRMANSPAYRGSEIVETIKDAVVRLGAEQVCHIAMAASHASMHVSRHDLVNMYMHKLWHHSHAVALGCRWTAINSGLRRLSEQAYMAGLLHDVGKLFLLKTLEKLSQSGVACSALEEGTLRDVFVELHVEQGARLMDHWNMPQIYRDAVARHHSETAGPEDMVLVVLKLVNSASRSQWLSLNPEPPVDVLTLREAGLLGFNQAKLAGLEAVLRDSRVYEYQQVQYAKSA